ATSPGGVVAVPAESIDAITATPTITITTIAIAFGYQERMPFMGCSSIGILGSIGLQIPRLHPPVKRAMLQKTGLVHPLPLPIGWPRRVRSPVVQVLSLVRTSLAPATGAHPRLRSTAKEPRTRPPRLTRICETGSARMKNTTRLAVRGRGFVAGRNPACLLN